MCYTLPEVYRLPVRTYAAIAINAPYRWRSSSHKANLIPQSKRQDTTVIVIPCLCSFNALCSPSAEFPINKKRTRTLSHRELGSSTNCLVEHQGVEPWHRSPGLSHFESLKLLDEAGSSRLSLAAEGILVTSKKHVAPQFADKNQPLFAK